VFTGRANRNACWGSIHCSTHAIGLKTIEVLEPPSLIKCGNAGSRLSWVFAIDRGRYSESLESPNYTTQSTWTGPMNLTWHSKWEPGMLSPAFWRETLTLSIPYCGVVGQAEHVTLPLSFPLKSLGEQTGPWAKLHM